MSKLQIPSAVTTKTLLSAAASIAASAVLFRTIINDLIPFHFQDHIFYKASSFLAGFSSTFNIIVQQFQGIVPLSNEMYMAAESYLASKISPSTRCLQVAKQEDSKGLEVTMEKGETVVDFFQGTEFKWKLISEEKEKSVVQQRRNNPFLNTTLILETKFFVLSFHKKHKEKALKIYLPHILQQFKEIKQEEKTIKIHTADYDNMFRRMGADAWQGVNLDHPATFETLAMEPEEKRKVKEDLERFARRKAYYRRVGKAWKRGYLLHGPPGTGKSSLIAAMANFLRFDIYDLELTEVRSNSTLRKLLVGIANRSIIVVEDIDCTIELQDRKNAKTDSESLGGSGNHHDKVTLSGLLNFIDGLWSSCGDERIIIFTTNHKERLDPALLRPGRMDMHVHMSYCSPSGFKTLLSNYHNVEDHPLCAEVDLLLREVEATPAEVAEELMKSDDTEVAMRGLIEFLLRKRAEKGETAEEATGVDFEVSKVEESKGLSGGEQSEGENDGHESFQKYVG